MSNLKRNFTARVTTRAELAPVPGGAVQAGPGAGRVRVRGTEVSFYGEAGKMFITDCARCIEGLKSDREIREAWGLDEQEWDRLAENMPLLNAVRAELERRVRSGETAREAAQEHFANAPSVLNEILHNQLVSPRARIEAARELRQVAAGDPKTLAAVEKFVINIDLGGDDKFVLETEIIPRPLTTEKEEW
jgi:hypothetical protein